MLEQTFDILATQFQKNFRKILGGNKKDKSVFFNAKFSKPDEFEDFININIVPL